MPYFPRLPSTGNPLLEMVQGMGPPGNSSVYIPPGTHDGWQRETAPDGQWWGYKRPPVGNGKNRFYGITEEQGKFPDSYPYFMNTPGLPWGETEQAYHPTLREEWAMNTPANKDLQKLWERKGWYPEQQQEASEFQRPKSLEEIFPADRYTNEAIRQMRPWFGMP